jgi:hypothetical protein
LIVLGGAVGRGANQQKIGCKEFGNQEVLKEKRVGVDIIQYKKRVGFN